MIWQAYRSRADWRSFDRWAALVAVALALVLLLMTLAGLGPGAAGGCCGPVKGPRIIGSSQAPAAETSPAAGPRLQAPAQPATADNTQTPATPRAAESAAAAPEPKIELSAANDHLTLSGEVADEAIRTALRIKAAETFGADNVIDRLVIRPGVGTLSWLPGAGALMSALKGAGGSVSMTVVGPVLSLEGLVDGPAAKQTLIERARAIMGSNVVLQDDSLQVAAPSIAQAPVAAESSASPESPQSEAPAADRTDLGSSESTQSTEVEPVPSPPPDAAAVTPPVLGQPAQEAAVTPPAEAAAAAPVELPVTPQAVAPRKSEPSPAAEPQSAAAEPQSAAAEPQSALARTEVTPPAATTPEVAEAVIESTQTIDADLEQRVIRAEQAGHESAPESAVAPMTAATRSPPVQRPADPVTAAAESSARANSVAQSIEPVPQNKLENQPSTTAPASVQQSSGVAIEPEPIAFARREPQLQLAIEGGRITLRGELADEAERVALLYRATRLFGEANVIDQLVVGSNVAALTWLNEADALLAALKSANSKLGLSVRGDASITVFGDVDSDQSKEQFTTAAIMTLGTSAAVDNRLEIRPPPPAVATVPAEAAKVQTAGTAAATEGPATTDSAATTAAADTSPQSNAATPVAASHYAEPLVVLDDAYLEFAVAAGQLTLSGRLSSEAERAALMYRADLVFGADRVMDSLRVESNLRLSPWLSSVDGILTDLKRLNDGVRLSIEGQRLRLQGKVESAEQVDQIYHRVKRLIGENAVVENLVQIVPAPAPAPHLYCRRHKSLPQAIPHRRKQNRHNQ
jgi:osmotically-inducible protein OsmY